MIIIFTHSITHPGHSQLQGEHTPALVQSNHLTNAIQNALLACSVCNVCVCVLGYSCRRSAFCSGEAISEAVHAL